MSENNLSENIVSASAKLFIGMLTTSQHPHHRVLTPLNAGSKKLQKYFVSPNWIKNKR